MAARTPDHARLTRAGRARARAARVYRRAVRALAAQMPPDSEDQNVAAFQALQADAMAARGWRGLLRVWLAEALALGRLARRAQTPRSRGAVMSSLRHDLRDAWRALRRTPSYTLAVVLTLALGIGVNTAIFSVVDALLLRALPYDEPDRIVRVAEWPTTGGNFTVAPAAYGDWRPAAESFIRLEARVGRRYVLLDAGAPQTIGGAAVTPGYFDLLGVRAAAGRTFAPGDGAADAPCRAVISHRLWQTRFGGDPAAVGADVRLADTPCAVIGVLPAGSVVDRLAAEVYTPLVLSPSQAQSQGRTLTVLGRLEPGVTLDAARERLAGVAEAFNATRGEAGEGWTSAITPWRDVVVRADARQLVWILFGAVGLVLLIACANVAGLALSRGLARRRELGIRAALGAGRWRLMRYLTVESLMLGLAGGAAGLLVGAASLRAFTGLMPSGLLPAEAAVALDARALAFTAGLSLLAGLIFGTVPAWQATRSLTASRGAGEDRTQSASRGTARLHAGLVVGEMAFAMVLVTGAVLLVASFVRLGSVDPGFDPDRVLTMQMAPPGSRYPSEEDTVRFLDEAMARLRAIPDVRHAAAVTSLPLGGWLYGTRFSVDGVPDDPERPTYAHIQHVAGSYFETLGLSMASGRTFTDADRAGTLPVVVVNETFARRYLPERRGAGHRLRLGIDALGRAPGDDVLWEIVGVMRDVKTGGLADAEGATPEIYVPQAQSPLTPVFVAVRGETADPRALEPLVRQAIRSIDPDLSIDDVRPMAERIGVSMRLERFRTTMITAFAVLAGLLAGFGIYAVRSRAVATRRREMGIRLALGATRGDVLRLVLGQGLTLAAAGIALGLAGAWWLAGVLERWLFATRATDPLMVAGAVGMLVVPAMLASWLPARRAASVDPCETLRAD